MTAETRAPETDRAAAAVAPPRPAPRAYASLQGVGRAMVVLEAVAERPMRAKELAERLGLKWTTAYRTLTHLLEQRYLRRDEATGTYSIGPRLYFLGQAYLMGHPVVAAGGEVLRAVAHETGASAQLNDREGFQAITLLSVDGTADIIPKTTPEFHFPLHAGSKGHVLLAFAEPEVLAALAERPLATLTEHTITDPDELALRLEEVRARGYAITREDVQLGTGSVSAPVFHGDGRLAGAVCLIVKAEELSEPATAALVGAVCRAARQISLRLGWRFGDAPAAAAAWERRSS